MADQRFSIKSINILLILWNKDAGSVSNKRMRTKIYLAAILLFLCSIQIIFAQKATQTEQNKYPICSDCTILGKLLFVPKPAYPKEAKDANVSGKVSIQIRIDKIGSVIEAKPISGNPLLFDVTIKAALKAKFTPAKRISSKELVNSVGILTYNFLPDETIQTNQENEESKQTENLKRKPIVDLGGGTLIGKEIKLPKPQIPFCNCSYGDVKSVTSVLVQAEINEQGNVIKATAVSGHPLLKIASEKAAQKSKFTPSLNSNERVKAKATIVYKFLIVNKWSVKFAGVEVKNIQIENQAAN